MVRIEEWYGNKQRDEEQAHSWRHLYLSLFSIFSAFGRLLLGHADYLAPLSPNENFSTNNLYDSSVNVFNTTQLTFEHHDQCSKQWLFKGVLKNNSFIPVRAC